MKTSDQINELATSLAKAQAKIEAAPKDSANPFYKSHYADLSSVWGACRGPLTENGLAIVQTADSSEGTVDITTRLIHTSGQWIEGTLRLAPTKNDPQGFGSAITYGRRYGLAAIVGVVADEDDDGNGASQPPGAKPQSKAKVEKPPVSPEQLAYEQFLAPELESGRIAKSTADSILKGAGNYTQGLERVVAFLNLKSLIDSNKITQEEVAARCKEANKDYPKVLAEITETLKELEGAKA